MPPATRPDKELHGDNGQRRVNGLPEGKGRQTFRMHKGDSLTV